MSTLEEHAYCFTMDIRLDARPILLMAALYVHYAAGPSIAGLLSVTCDMYLYNISDFCMSLTLVSLFSKMKIVLIFFGSCLTKGF